MAQNIDSIIKSIPQDATIEQILTYFVDIIVKAKKSNDLDEESIKNIRLFYTYANAAKAKKFNLKNCLERNKEDNQFCYGIDLVLKFNNPEDDEISLLDFLSKYIEKYGKNEDILTSVFVFIASILYNMKDEEFQNFFG